jgi:hypothetical protein
MGWFCGILNTHSNGGTHQMFKQKCLKNALLKANFESAI